MTDWRTEAETLLRTIGGEDAPAVMYLIDGDELPPELQPVELLGCTAWDLSQAVRPWLESRGEWQGEGFAALVFPSRIASACGVTLPEVLDALCINVAAHEFAHEVERQAFIAAWQGLGGTIPPADEPAIAARRLMQPAIPGPPWARHGTAYIRATLHLSWKAHQSGRWLPPTNIGAAGIGYGLSSILDYQAALGDEPSAREGEQISQILTSPAPPEFTALFAADTKAWNEAHPAEAAP